MGHVFLDKQPSLAPGLTLPLSYFYPTVHSQQACVVLAPVRETVQDNPLPLSPSSLLNLFLRVSMGAGKGKRLQASHSPCTSKSLHTSYKAEQKAGVAMGAAEDGRQSRPHWGGFGGAQWPAEIILP